MIIMKINMYNKSYQLKLGIINLKLPSFIMTHTKIIKIIIC